MNAEPYSKAADAKKLAVTALDVYVSPRSGTRGSMICA